VRSAPLDILANHLMVGNANVSSNKGHLRTSRCNYHHQKVNSCFYIACQCNGHADTCDDKTGKCQCRMKGVSGNNCET
jgi:hypothetical protein